MIFIHNEDIKVPEGRFRQEFNPADLAELQRSILTVGLISPISVEQNGDTWILRAGERRLRALRAIIKENKPFRIGTDECTDGLVPAVEWSELTPLQRLEIEVEENIVRTDFAWQERVRALEALHKLRSEQNPGQTITATAQEVAKRQGTTPNLGVVSDALIISRHLGNPDVAKARDPKEALKIIRKQAELVHQAKLAETFDVSKVEHKLILGDSIETMSAMSEKQFDVILIDPPYGVGANSFGSQSDLGHDYEDSPKYLEGLLKDLPDQLYRVAKERAHCYLFCDLRWFERISTLMVLAKWEVFPTPLIWYKGSGRGMVPLPKHGPRRTYEHILYAWKGGRETLVLKDDCITKIPAVSNLKHAAQKPVALYCELLSRSARPGDVVLDCFGGVGTILVAANIRKLKATYIEKKEQYFNVAKQRAATKEIDDGAEEDDGLDIPF
jgi:DNA modification methylase